MCGFKFLCEIQKVPFEISHNILNSYTVKYAFYEVLKIWRLMIYYSYDSLSLRSRSVPMPRARGDLALTFRAIAAVREV